MEKPSIFRFDPCSENPGVPDPLWNTIPPLRGLWIQGTEKALELLSNLPEQGLAIVGTRLPQFRSLELLKSSLRDLVGYPKIILSGLARGIDSAAHEAALAYGLPTIAVLGHGLGLPTYPAENEELRNRILGSGGLIVSEYEPEEPPRPHYFLQRNRIIAGWAKATWIVEASHRSGALNTARWAREMNRECFATPSFPGDPAFSGNQGLLNQAEAADFWGIESLGKAWLELATARHARGRSRSLGLLLGTGSPSSPGLPEDQALVEKIALLGSQSGGAQVHELLDWAVSCDWSPEKFFAALERVIRSGIVADRHGVLVSADNH